MGLVLLGGVVSAEVPRLLHYQGRLTEPDGTPLSGEHAVTFRLYDAAVSGATVWEETHEIRFDARDEGLFSTNLGSLTSFPETLQFTEPVWLTTEVDGDGELLPRQQLTAVAYAMNADLLDGLEAEAFLRIGQVSVAVPAEVGSAAQTGVGTDISRSDHAHRGLHSLAAAGQSPIFGNAVLAEGENVTLTQDGQTITVDAESPEGVSLSDEAPANVSETEQSGAVEAASRADHAHQGLHSLAVAGQDQLLGDAVLAEGENVTLTQDGQTITIAAADSAGASGGRASAASTSATAIAVGSDTTLLSATITKSQDSTALLIIASVQLEHTSNPPEKIVDLKLFRDGAQLDASYMARVGTAGRTVSEWPATIHSWDTSAAGTYTISLTAQSDGGGAQATVRRLTILEL